MTWTQHKQTSPRRTWWESGPYVVQALANGDYEAWCGAEWLGISGLLGGAKNLCALHAGPAPATNLDDDYSKPKDLNA